MQFNFFLFQSCDSELNSLPDKTVAIQSLNELEVIDGVLHIDNKESLQKIIDDYKNSDSNQLRFNEFINELQDDGFKSLNPIYSVDDSEFVENFLKQKIKKLKSQNARAKSKQGSNSILGRSVSDIEEISFEDDVIQDPAFSSLLNEEREIIIENIIYKYTDFGLFYCDYSKQDELDNYLSALSEQDILSLIGVDRLNYNESDELGEVNKVLDGGINYFLPESGRSLLDADSSFLLNSSTSNLAANPSADSYVPLSDYIKQNLPLITIQKQGFFERLFGATEDNVTYLKDGRRVVVKFWNQNYYLFSSIGCKVKTQKRMKKFGISWWEKTYVEKIELGVNSMSYEYKFNVPAYNHSKYLYETTFFEYNGTKYNSAGKIINTVPTSIGTFNFDLSSAQTGLKIFVAGYEVTNKDVNQLVDKALNTVVNASQDFMVKNDIIQKATNGKLKYEIVNAVPFSDKVKFIVTRVNWSATNDHQVAHYFDRNFLFTYKSSYDGTLDYLNGLRGSTAYTNVNIDFYGAVYNDGEWSGSRLIQKE